MSTALFNPPTPKNWFYIIIIGSCFLLIAILNSGCKTRKLEQESSKVIDKTEQSSSVSKKDSTDTKQTKSETTQTTAKTVQSDSGLVITEKTKTSLFDSLGKIKSIVETVKITDKKGLTKTATIAKKATVESNISQSIFNSKDSTGTKKNDIIDESKSKGLDAKKESSNVWAIFGIVLVLGSVFVIWKFKY